MGQPISSFYIISRVFRFLAAEFPPKMDGSVCRYLWTREPTNVAKLPLGACLSRC